RPKGHQPPCSMPFSIAKSSAARSTPVCPPEIIFTTIHISRTRVIRLLIVANDRSRRGAHAWYGLARAHALCIERTRCAPFSPHYGTPAQYFRLRRVFRSRRVRVSILSPLESFGRVRGDRSSNRTVDLLALGRR